MTESPGVNPLGIQSFLARLTCEIWPRNQTRLSLPGDSQSLWASEGEARGRSHVDQSHRRNPGEQPLESDGRLHPGQVNANAVMLAERER